MELSIEKELRAPLVEILTKYGKRFSSVPALVAFKLTVDGKVLTPIGAYPSDITQGIVQGQILTKEVTYGNMSRFLVCDDVNLIPAERFLANRENVVPDVPVYVKHVTIRNDLEKPSTSFTLPQNDENGICSRGYSFELGGAYEIVELTLMFVERAGIRGLPEEFHHFRTYGGGWLTLSDSYSPVIKPISWQSESEWTDLLTVEFNYDYPEIKETYLRDLRTFTNLLKRKEDTDVNK